MIFNLTAQWDAERPVLHSHAERGNERLPYCHSILISLINIPFDTPDPDFPPRDYRNRRIGDFLKELHLTEGRSTGIPKMRRAMKNNGSPMPIFETDKERSYFLTVLPIHPHVDKNKIHTEAHVEAHINKELLTETEQKIIFLCKDEMLSRKKIAEKLGHKARSGSLKKALSHLLQSNVLEYTIPDKPRSSKQRYKTTNKGLSLLRT